MLYETFNSLKEARGEDYFISRLDSEIDEEKYGISKEDKAVNKQFYGG